MNATLFRRLALLTFALVNCAGYSQSRLAVDFVWQRALYGGSDLPFTLGWTFTCRTNVTVSGLAIWDIHDLVNDVRLPHRIGLWTDGGILLSTVTVGPADTLVTSPNGAEFRYSSISPVFLAAGQSYRIGAEYYWGGSYLDAYADRFQAFYPDPNFTFGTGAYGPSQAGFAFPMNLASNQGFFGPNFFFQPIPEPATVSLAVIGVTALVLFQGRNKTNQPKPFEVPRRTA